MNNPSAPVLERPAARGGFDECDCFADAPPLPMGCAVCGHAPYAHGCPSQTTDHEYAQPSGKLMAERLDVRRRLGMGRTPPPFEHTLEGPTQPTPLVPTPCQAEPDSSSPRVQRLAAPNKGSHRPVETQENRTIRLALTHDPLARRRTRTKARTQERVPYQVRTDTRPHRGIVGYETTHPRLGDPASRWTLPLLPDILNAGDRRQLYQPLSRGPAVTFDWRHSPDTFPPRRREAAA
ncbi:hypothetical protein GCM10018952_58410 [Streptosporangium vulgare]